MGGGVTPARCGTLGVFLFSFCSDVVFFLLLIFLERYVFIYSSINRASMSFFFIFEREREKEREKENERKRPSLSRINFISVP